MPTISIVGFGVAFGIFLVYFIIRCLDGVEKDTIAILMLTLWVIWLLYDNIKKRRQ